MQQKGDDEKYARQRLQQSDFDSSGYISAYFDADWDNKNLYDMIINTRTISLETGVVMITSTASADEFKPSQPVYQQFSDLALAQKVESAVLGIPGLKISNLGVEKGVVDLYGEAKSKVVKEECEKIISTIKGINKVINQLEVVDKKRPRIV